MHAAAPSLGSRRGGIPPPGSRPAACTALRAGPAARIARAARCTAPRTAPPNAPPRRTHLKSQTPSKRRPRKPHSPTPSPNPNSNARQMNLADSERMAGVLEAAGYDCAEDASAADVLVYNTCSIRERAEVKVYSALGRQARRGGGCARRAWGGGWPGGRGMRRAGWVRLAVPRRGFMVTGYRRAAWRLTDGRPGGVRVLGEGRAGRAAHMACGDRGAPGARQLTLGTAADARRRPSASASAWATSVSWWPAAWHSRRRRRC